MAPPLPAFVRELRKEKGVSQRTLAKQLGIPRANLQRLERMPGERLTFRDLCLVAQGLGYKVEELIERLRDDRKENPLARAGIKIPSFVLQRGQGAKFSSFMNRTDLCFIGAVHLAPQATLSKENAPKGQLVFYLVFEGVISLSLFGKDYLFKSGECFFLTDPSDYEIYNPHQLQEIILIAVISPSFILTT